MIIYAEEMEVEGAFGYVTSFGIQPFGWEDIYFFTQQPRDLKGDISSDGNILLNSLEAPLGVIFENYTSESHTVLLKFFLNYEEVAFRVLGTEYYLSEFELTVPSGYGVEIPIILDKESITENSTYKLTSMMFLNPHSHDMNHDNDLWASGKMALDIELSYVTESYIELSLVHNYFPQRSYQIEGNHRGINILIGEDIYGGMRLPAIQVRSGSELEMNFLIYLLGPKTPALIVGSGENEEIIFNPTESYMILALLDWQPAEMNGSPYLFISAEENNYYGMHHVISLSLSVPEDPGFYEFIAFIIPNPEQRTSLLTFFPHHSTVRFTIEVIEYH